MTYEVVAHEYFNEERHPTAFALGEASRIFYRQFALCQGERVFSTVLEIGPGPRPVSDEFHLEEVIFVDSSPTMLAQAPPQGRGLICEAGAIPVENGSVDLILASLGDPYNTDGFWKEVARALKPGALCLFTAPSIVWSTRFRSIEGSPPDSARFALADGSTTDLPSYILDEKDQAALLESVGLVTIEYSEIARSEIEHFPAPKLTVIDSDESLVCGWVAMRR